MILFGLSMDYHVFILSRIKEGWDKGLGNAPAVEQGIRSSAGVVTAAAAVMVAVFAIFATLSLVDLQEFGIGLAVAVADRRDADPRRRPAGLHEAPRQVELVHAAQPDWLPALGEASAPVGGGAAGATRTQDSTARPHGPPPAGRRRAGAQPTSASTSATLRLRGRQPSRTARRAKRCSAALSGASMRCRRPISAISPFR